MTDLISCVQAMSQIEKLIKKLRNAKAEARASDIERFLIHMGFEKDRQRGSHVQFCRESTTLGFVMHKGKVKIVYLKDILHFFNLL